MGYRKAADEATKPRLVDRKSRSNKPTRISSNIDREFFGTLTGKKKKSAYKPGSVENSHSSRLQVTLQLKQSTQEPRGPRVCPSI